MGRSQESDGNSLLFRLVSGVAYLRLLAKELIALFWSFFYCPHHFSSRIRVFAFAKRSLGISFMPCTAAACWNAILKSSSSVSARPIQLHWAPISLPRPYFRHNIHLLYPSDIKQNGCHFCNWVILKVLNESSKIPRSICLASKEYCPHGTVIQWKVNVLKL